MSADNVTPIRGSGDRPAPTAPKKARAPRAKAGLVLAESGEFDSFTTQDVLNGLHGVCLALDLKGDDCDIEEGELATAAHVLASILQSRVT